MFLILSILAYAQIYGEQSDCIQPAENPSARRPAATAVEPELIKVEPPVVQLQNSESKPPNRSFLNRRNWVLGDPNNVFWFSVFVAYVAFRAFSSRSPHHEVGCVAAVASAIAFFALQVASGIDGHVVMSLSVAGLAYAVATISCWFNEKRLDLADRARDLTVPVEATPAGELSDQIAAIQADLESQLKSISDSPFDDETLDDLRETAKQAAVERMAIILESD